MGNKKYIVSSLVVLISLFFISCTDDDPCIDKSCQENSSCELKEDKAVCYCNEGYIEKNSVCTREEISCDVDCGENSHCVVIGEVETCKCIEDFHHPEEGNETCVHSKQVLCKALNPENSTIDETLVDVTWNDETNDWNEAIKCSWSCNADFHAVSNTSCQSNTKKENCIDISVENAISTVVKVDVTWDTENNKWNTPPNCDWECKEGYHNTGVFCDENEICTVNSCNNGVCNDSTGIIECRCEPGYTGDTCDTCDTGFQDNDNDGSCEPACNEALCTDTNSHCDDSTGVASCICNNDTHIEGIECFSNTKEVPCDSSNIPRENTTYVEENVTITWNDSNLTWNTPIECEWSCNSSYQYDENTLECIPTISKLRKTGAIMSKTEIVIGETINKYMEGIIIAVKGNNTSRHHGAYVCEVGAIEYGCLYIDFYNIQGETFVSPTLGAIVKVKGVHKEYYGETRLLPQTAEDFEIIGSGEVPTPIELAVDEFQEKYEGMLIKVKNPPFVVYLEADVSADPRRYDTEMKDSNDISFFMSSSLQYPYYDLPTGTTLTTIVGIMTYSYGKHKMFPRFAADLVIVE